jgi:hypothetical protein
VNRLRIPVVNNVGIVAINCLIRSIKSPNQNNHLIEQLKYGLYFLGYLLISYVFVLKSFVHQLRLSMVLLRYSYQIYTFTMSPGS